MKKISVLTLSMLSCSVLALGSMSGCDSVGGDEAEGGLSGVLRFLIVPAPGAVNNTQAVCAEGSDALEAAEALVDEMNGELGSDQALLEAIADESPDSTGPISVYEVEVDGRTLTVEEVTDGTNATYTGTIDGEAVLSGATSDNNAQGALTFGDLQVAWDESEPGVVRAARTSGDTEAAVFLEEDRVRIVRQSGDSQIVAGWTETEGLSVDGDNIQCWNGDEQCDVACTPDLVDSLSASLD